MSPVVLLGVSLEVYRWTGAITGLAFVFALGAIVGSFLNVVVYRLPAGVNLVTPASRCPHCETRLSWKQNFPIFGWLWLLGRCRFCKSPISIQYPLIELIVALLFSIPFVLWFMRPSLAGLVGVDAEALTPAWALDGFVLMWPQLVLIWCLLGSLVAITLIDARTFMIPGGLPRFVIISSLLIHTAHALYVQLSEGALKASDEVWAIPVPSAPWLGVAILGTVGIVVSELLMRARVLPVPFADYEVWAEAHERELEEAEAKSEADEEGPRPDEDEGDESGSTLSVAVRRAVYLTAPAIALMFAGFALGLRFDRPLVGTFIGLVVGLGIGLVLRRIALGAPSDGDDGAGGGEAEAEWVLYPHARREMGKEVLLVLPTLVLGGLGWWLCSPGGALFEMASSAPLWLDALGGSLLGLIVGGGTVWAIRIIATLAFGKEAMGFGDVHLMAAVGAALGWIDPVIAFFTAPFPALLWAAGSVLSRGMFNRSGSALPFGPHLAAATVLLVLARPAYEWVYVAILAPPMP